MAGRNSRYKIIAVMVVIMFTFTVWFSAFAWGMSRGRPWEYSTPVTLIVFLVLSLILQEYLFYFSGLKMLINFLGRVLRPFKKRNSRLS